MRGYRVATVWAIPIRIHISLLVVLPVFAWLIGSGVQLELYADLVNGLVGTSIDATVLQAGQLPWLVGGAAAVGLFVSVTLHELATRTWHSGTTSRSSRSPCGSSVAWPRSVGFPGSGKRSSGSPWPGRW